MHDIWNPWHGCRKCSEGVRKLLYVLPRPDAGSGWKPDLPIDIRIRYPLSKDRQGKYKVKSGEMIRVCMTSDFFLEEADAWRDDAWSVMRERKRCEVFLADEAAGACLFLSPLRLGRGMGQYILQCDLREPAAGG